MGIGNTRHRGNKGCRCGRVTCGICCPRNNNRGPTGPQGIPGPTGPCCTGPAAPTTLVSCGHLTVNFDPEDPTAPCQLVVFRFSGVAAFEEFQVSPTARGWLLTWEAIPGETPANDLARGAVITIGESIQFGFEEAPPVILKFQQTPPAAPGGLPRTLFWLEDANTGQPIDPCCVVPAFGSYHFARQVCNDTFNFLFADVPLPSPCTPAAPGLAAARARGVPISEEALEDRRRFRRR